MMNITDDQQVWSIGFWLNKTGSWTTNKKRSNVNELLAETSNKKNHKKENLCQV